MTPRRGQATVEWVAVVAIAAVIAAGALAVVARHAPSAAPLGALLGSLAAAPANGAVGARLPPLGRVDGGGIVAVADRLAQLGIAEAPPGSNRGGAVDVFTGGRAEPWCADFVSWVLRAAGHPLVGGEEGWRYPWTGDIRAWFAARGRFRERAVADPRPGDVVWFVHGHVGIVVRVRGATIETVEGNAGDAVRRIEHGAWRADPDIGGFGRVPAAPAR